MKQKNGKIELMRFVFCVCIVLFHIAVIDNIFPDTKIRIGPLCFFYRGYLGVEYFFLVSGALMAKSVRSRIRKEEAGEVAPAASIGDETLGFLWGKVRAILPYHLLFCLIMLVLLVVGYPENFPSNVLDQFLSLFLLHRTGLTTDSVIAGEWYISAMLLVMALYYPLCKKYYLTFTHLVAPFAGVMILGYMYLTVGKLSGADLVNGITYHSNYRALAEIAIGLTCYEVSLVLAQKKFTKGQRLLISCLEGGGYLATLLYICSDFNVEYETIAFFLLCVSVTLSFSQKGLLGESRLFQNRFCCFLGAISMPVYLCQNIGRRIANLWFSDVRPRNRLIGVFVFTLALGVGTYLVWNWIQKQPNRNKIVKRLSAVLLIAGVTVSAAAVIRYQLAI
ncbi:MAG: acyltransferase [Clostridiales bacterium]|nr:acyltransferase [Clostridiales bacterium]